MPRGCLIVHFAGGLALLAIAGCADRPGNEVTVSCPPREPIHGVTCGGNLVCTYEACGQLTVARCEAGRWVVQQPADPADACP